MSQTRILLQKTHIQNETETTTTLFRAVHWFDYVLCTLWIFCMMFIGIAMSGSASATSRYIDSMAGLGHLYKIEDVQQASKLVTQIFLGKVDAQAAVATTGLQIAQLSFDRIIQVAIVAFVRALLTTVFNFLKNILSKLKESRSQIARLFNISGPAKKLFQILGGRQNVCRKVENFVSGLFAQNSYSSPLALAYSQSYRSRAFSSVLSNPSEILFGMAYGMKSLISSVSLSAQTDTEVEEAERRAARLRADQEYLENNLGSINSNSEGCYFGITNTQNKVQTTPDPRETVRHSYYALIDSCSSGIACDDNGDGRFNGVLDSIVNISNPPTRTIINSNTNTDNAGVVVSVFNDFYLRTNNPSKSIEREVAKSAIRSTISQAAEAAKAQTTVGGNDANNTIAIANPSAISGDKGGAIRHASSDALCGEVESGLGSLTASTQIDLSNTSTSNALSGASLSGTPTDQDIARALANNTANYNLRAMCPVTVSGIGPEAEVQAQAQSAIQQSNSGSGGGTNLADAVIALVNTFIKSVMDLLVDTLFSFVNTIIGSFCSNFAIDAICDSLSTTSKQWQRNLRSDVKDVRINSTKYNSFYEYYSGNNLLIGSNEVEVNNGSTSNRLLQLD